MTNGVIAKAQNQVVLHFRNLQQVLPTAGRAQLVLTLMTQEVDLSTIIIQQINTLVSMVSGYDDYNDEDDN